MAEYIDKWSVANKLIDLENEFQQYKPFHGFEHAMYRKVCEAEIAIGKTPAADVVEVVWKPVVGFEGLYEVSSLGRVRNKKGEILKQRIKRTNCTCYKSVDLWKDGRYHKKYIHRLLAEAFIPNPDNLPMVNHKDEDGTNNFIDNLEWCTREYNVNYGTAKERRAKKIRGVPHTEEHNRKISASMKAYRERERKEKGCCYNGRGARMDGNG